MNNLNMEPLLLNDSDNGMEMSTLKQQFPESSAKTLRDHVEQAMRSYFANLGGEQVTDVYDMVLAEIEAPLLEVVLEYTRGNQTRASEILGLNRGTLRKKLKDHGLM
ncbi:MAG: DNA-binding transcriptional regulator Fis [Moraxellaceae bacterium]|jgi:Fis family transcriptional regulator|nr:DNA-binding transcriptional regulator Fis [Moraxellaceae bacterium]MDF3030370.1 DNA-binding transcriptional regulator Fis [Moraxellaceae bacterium]